MVAPTSTKPQTVQLLPHPSASDYPVQGTPQKGTAKPNETGAYRHAGWTNLKTLQELIPCDALFESGLSLSPEGRCLGHRPLVRKEPATWASEYVWQTFTEVDKRRRAVGSALVDLFSTGRLQAGADFQTVGIWSINRPEWKITDLAIQSYDKVSVSLYDTLGPNSIEYIVNHAEISIVFATEKNLDTLFKLSPQCPTLKMVVSYDILEPSVKAKYLTLGKETGIEFMDFEEFENHGNSRLVEPIPATLDQISAICYTSGTTGTPKGVVMSHRNIASLVVYLLQAWGTNMPQKFTSFSYLPHAHAYGRVCEVLALSTGGNIGYYSGSPLNLMSDLQVLKPHFFPAVPRILSRVYQQVMKSASAPGVKGYLFRWALGSKKSNWESNGTVKHPIWDAVIFKKVQEVFGGNVKLIICGSAPVSTDVLDFFKIAMPETDIIEGYGLTETMACVTKCWPADPKSSGTVGPPIGITELKLVDVPELNYYSTDKPRPRGELCARGDNVFVEYYKDKEQTAKAKDADGWFHSGDIAEIDEAGRFKIIDRIKNIMKLAQGEYVALEKVETVYTSMPIISQVYIHGESVRDHLLAVIVPEPLFLAKIAETVGYKFDYTSNAAVEQAILQPQVVKAVLEDTQARAKASGLKGFEVAKNVHLTTTQFTVENGALTPTMKMIRRAAYQLHKPALDALYASA